MKVRVKRQIKPLGKVAGKIRIVGGAYRGRPIYFHDSPGLRPTPNRVRETVFNWLRPYLHGARCLDLFAGSGALGMEALSQGADSVVFVELNHRTAKSIEETLSEFSADNGRVFCGKAETYLNRPKAQAQSAEAYDLVFLDPPFNKGLISGISADLSDKGWLNPGALVYIETEKNTAELRVPQTWQSLKQKITGEVAYHLFLSNGA